MSKGLFAFVLVGSLSVGVAGYNPAHAQGIMVQNPQGFSQRAAQFSQQIANMVDQLTQAKSMLSSMTGNAGLGNLAPQMLGQLRNVLPSNWESVYSDAMSTSSQLSSSAGQINSAFGNQISGMDHLQALQYTMTQMQSQGGYDRAMAQQAYNGINSTFDNLQEISGQINSVQTEKDSIDLQNRLQAASGQVQTQVAQIQLMQMLQNAQEKLVKMQQEKAQTAYAFGDLDNISTPDFGN